MLDRYPDAPGFKASGTSEQAAASVVTDAARLQRAVMSVLYRHSSGLTADQCAEFMGEPILSVRPRFSELQRKGMIEETGERRRNKSGRAANVYRAKK
jgi:predicted ArsR family transcriptional regulator